MDYTSSSKALEKLHTSDEELLTFLPEDFPNYEETDIENKDVDLQKTDSINDKEPVNIPNNTFKKESSCENTVSENDNVFEKKKEDDIETKELDFSNQIDDLNKAITDIKDVIENIQYNVAMLVKNQATAADVAVLQRENEAFRSDSNIKLMRRYGIDAMIKTYQAICDRIFRINHSISENTTNDSELTILNWALKRIERQFKPLGIKLKTSPPGTDVDESIMVVYGSNGEEVDDKEAITETDDENLKHTVKESVCPAFICTIPSLIGNVIEWCMEAEKVCIYK